MMWMALGGIALAVLAWAATVLIAYEAGGRDKLAKHKQQLAENRSQRRKEARTVPARGRHQLSAFPADDNDEWLEKLATTGELAMYAETGEVDRLRGEVAQFFRTLSLREWTRKREDAA